MKIYKTFHLYKTIHDEDGNINLRDNLDRKSWSEKRLELFSLSFLTNSI